MLCPLIAGLLNQKWGKWPGISVSTRPPFTLGTPASSEPLAAALAQGSLGNRKVAVQVSSLTIHSLINWINDIIQQTLYSLPSQRHSQVHSQRGPQDSVHRQAHAASFHCGTQTPSNRAPQNPGFKAWLHLDSTRINPIRFPFAWIRTVFHMFSWLIEVWACLPCCFFKQEGTRWILVSLSLLTPITFLGLSRASLVAQLVKNPGSLSPVKSFREKSLTKGASELAQVCMLQFWGSLITNWVSV